jgi:hypothetical protein
MSFIVQKIKKQEKTALDLAIKYYSIICLINDIKLSKRQIQLLAFTSIRGTISSLSAKTDFSNTFNSSIATVNNLISELSGLGLLEQFQGKYRVKDKINLNFAQRDIDINIVLTKKPKDEPESN